MMTTQEFTSDKRKVQYMTYQEIFTSEKNKMNGVH